MRYLIAALMVGLGSVDLGAAELKLQPRDNVSQEWRDLADHYRDQREELRKRREERGEKAQSLKDQLNELDYAKMSEQSRLDYENAQYEYASSLGDSFVDYFSGPGKPKNIIEAGTTIITETLPALADMYDAAFAPIDFEFKREELETELGRYEREMTDFKKKIDNLEKEIEFSENAADFYEQEVITTKQATKEVVFRLVETSKKVKQVAQEKHDTIPPGWVECSCPGVHVNDGRVINGKRFHPGGLNCPR